MAENKKSFVAYADWKSTFDELPDEYAGKLIKHIFAYVNDENPKSNDIIINAVFANIKNSLKRDLVKWQETKIGRSKAGIASAEARKLAKINEQNLTNPTNVDFVQQNSTNSTVSVSVSVSDNVNEKIKKDNTALPQKFSFYNSLIYYGFKKELVSDWISVRKNKKATNTQTAFNSFIREIEKRTCSLNEILEFIVSKNWSGFKWEWYDKENNFKSNENGKSTITQTEQFKQIAQAVRSDGIRR